MLHDAMFAENRNGNAKCYLCPHHCLIGESRTGLCSVRRNEGGVLKTINYGEITSMALDPVEKKPLYHFKPGSSILSVGSFGCNFTCGFCQNFTIAQSKAESEYFTPGQLIEACMGIEDNIGIAFTYNEPSIWYEYVYDTSKLLKEKNPEMNTVLVTNGYIGHDALAELLPYIDAMNIDLKSFSNDYYRKVCGGDVKSVRSTIETAFMKCHMEITTLLVSGLNDSEEEVEEIASYIASLDRNIPLHLSRYFPMYKMRNPPTDIDTMKRAKIIAEKHLNHVYLGNVEFTDSSTYCPGCGRRLIERTGYRTRLNISSPECPSCSRKINLVL